MAKKTNFKVHLPEWFNRLYPEATWRVATDEKVIYLTFDDGPVPGVTQAVLDILRDRNIVATFFCVGDNVSKYPEIYNQIIDEGHATGNHTFNHLHGIKNSKSDYLANIEKASGFIHSKLFRPPYGLLKNSQYKELKKQYKVIMWDVISCDYDPSLTPEQCYKNVMDFVRNGSIITFHDSYKAQNNVLATLPRVIDQLIKEGYSFQKIEFNSSQPDIERTDTTKSQHLHRSAHKVRERA